MGTGIKAGQNISLSNGVVIVPFMGTGIKAWDFSCCDFANAIVPFMGTGIKANSHIWDITP